MVKVNHAVKPLIRNPSPFKGDTFEFQTSWAPIPNEKWGHRSVLEIPTGPLVRDQ